MKSVEQLRRCRRTGLRSYLLLCFALMMLLGGLSKEARAQWTTNGNNINNTNSGNVGIGTTAPASKLEVTGSTLIQRITNTDATAYGVLGFFEGATQLSHIGVVGSTANPTNYIGGPSAFQVWNFANAPIVFGTNSAERVRISGSGNVGIGTTSPAAKLEVSGTVYSASAPTNTLFSGVVGATNANFVGSSGYWALRTATNNSYNLDVYNSGAPLAALTVLQSGNIGIGTTNPLANLHVKGTHATVQFEPSSPSNYAYVNLGNGSSYGWQIGKDVDAGSFGGAGFYIYEVTTGQQATRFAINKGGNVGIGTTSPSTKLHVVGDITVTGNINAKFQDVAEWVPSRHKLAPGTVVVLDTEQSNQVTASTRSYDTKVAGVVSAQPGVILGEAGENKAMIATTGRVKVRVDATRAPVKVGDLLVTSDLEGLAMKSVPLDLGGTPIHRPGTLIGKALEPLEKGTGEILVLLSLQ